MRFSRLLSFSIFVAVVGWGSASGAPASVFNEPQGTVEHLADPTGAAFDDRGLLYVIEGALHRIRVLDRDLRTVRTWGSPGELSSEFLFPSDLVIRDGSVYVADRYNGRVQVFDVAGGFKSIVGAYGLEAPALIEPTGIDVDSRFLYVADHGAHRIQVFDLEGKPVRTIGRYGAGGAKGEPPELIEPWDVAVDGEGRIYVSDSGNHRIVVLDHEGRWLRSWGGRGSEPGFFSRTGKLVVFDEHLYVVDRENHRVQVFTLEGDVVGEWGLHAVLPHQGQGHLHYPDTIAIERAEHSGFRRRAIVTEPFENRAQLFVANPEWSSERPDSTPSRPDSHFGERCATLGSLLAVTEMERGTIALYDLRGEERPILTTRFGGYGTAIDQLRRPSGVALGSGRRIYVCDPASRKLNVYEHAFDPNAEPRFQPRLVHFVKSLDWARFHAAVPELSGYPIPQPEFVHFDGQSRLYFIDPRSSLILILDERLGYVSHFGKRGKIDVGHLYCPNALTTSPDRALVYVVDRGNQRIQTYDPNHRHLYSWGKQGKRLGEFLDPFGIVSIADDDKVRSWVFVSDRQAHSIQKFDAQGRRIGRWGGDLPEDAKPVERLVAEALFKPTSLAYSPRSNEVVALDFGHHRFQLSPGRTPEEVLRQGGEVGPFRLFGSKVFLKPIGDTPRNPASRD